MLKAVGGLHLPAVVVVTSRGATEVASRLAYLLVEHPLLITTRPPLN